MKGIRFVVVAVVLVALVAAGLALAPSAMGQAASTGRDDRPQVRALEMLSGRGSELGVSIRDVDKADIAREKLGGEAGAVIEEVRSDSPAAKAGIKAGDVVVEFDGERVRSARQLQRLVTETPAGREVPMAVVRGGQKVAVKVTPAEGRGLAVFEGGRGLERLGRLSQDFRFALPELRDFEIPRFEFDMRTRMRLGVTLSELTPQLSEHFGVKDGVLVTEVASGSSALAAGVKAGDVITSIDGQPVDSADDVRRRVSEATGEDVTIGVMRDRKELTLKAKIDGAERPRRGAARRTV